RTAQAARSHPARAQGGRPAALERAPLEQEHLCPGDRRRQGGDAGRGLEPRQGLEGADQEGIGRRGGQGGGQAHRGAGDRPRGEGGRLRPRRLSLSRPGQGARRGRPRGRIDVLVPAFASSRVAFRRPGSPRNRRKLEVSCLLAGLAPCGAKLSEQALGKGKAMARNVAQREGREESELVEKLVSINRVAKVVKGGRRFGFAALVVVGDGKGRVGFGSGKAREVPEAIRKATEQAKRGMVRVPLREGRTLHHDIHGHYGAGRVVLRTAPVGTGIIAGGPMRAVFEALGVQDVVAKSVGTSNPHNMIKATFEALGHLTSPRAVAARRGKRVAEILGRREAETRETV